ncbi:Hpt domain-containing protein [Arthrobacter sp. TMS1-12-1]
MLPTTAPPALPLVDLAVLSQLEGQFTDPRPVRAFARDYITGFGDRYLRLTRSVGDQDLPAALEAALSLRNSSVMVGAERLSALAATFEAAVTSADLDAARRALPCIERCGLDTIDELEAGYLAV